jgi:hypothetical protein
MGGLYRISRNRVYVGVYTTLRASVRRTLNPVLLLLGALIVAVHHKIVLAEGGHLRNVFGNYYVTYYSVVRRYL